MWNLYFIFAFISNRYFLLSLNASLISLDRYKRSNADMLWNTSPPTVDKELHHVKFYNHEVLRLHCNIGGSPRPSFQWYVSTTEIVDLTVNMQDIVFEKVISGNDFTLDITDNRLNKKFFKYAYYCVAQNPLGILHSNKIIVEKVIRPNKIFIKYTQYSVNEGEKFVIQCQTTPDLWSGLFKFKRWEIRLRPNHILSLNKTDGRYSIITSTKTPELHIRNVTKDDFLRTKVRCILESTVDFKEAESFFQPVEKINYEAPSYLSHNCNNNFVTINAYVGNDIELPWCTIPKTLDVTWFKADNFKTKIEVGNKLNDTKYRKVSPRYGNLLIKNVSKEDSGKYMAIATAKFNKPISLIYDVNIFDVAAITITPTHIQKELSETTEILCEATYSKSQFYWLHNGQKVTAGYDDGNVEISNTNKKSILRIKNIRLSVVGIYQCIAAADNELKSITEYKQLSASLLVSKVPPFLYKQSPRVERDTFTAQIQISNKNNIKTIECIFSANPKPNIDWYLDSKKVPMKSLFSISVQEDTKSIYNFIAKLTINLDQINSNEEKRIYGGEYQAVATNALGSASCKTFVLMDGPLELRLPTDQIAVGGKDYLLSCYFVAMGVPEFSWDRKPLNGKWESMPSNHRTMLREKNHKLLLKNVIKVEDEGTYRCTAKFNRETKIGTTYLSVANPPNLQQLPLKHEISERNYYICTVNNKADKPWYVWWTFTKYNSNETIEINPDNINYPDFSVKYDNKSPYRETKKISGLPSFLYSYSNKGVNLIIKERSYEKGALGKFTCHAKNHIGSTEMSIEDNFLSLEFKIVPPSTSEVVVGNDLYLNCTAKKSDLDPFTKWKISIGDKYIEINEMKEKYENRIYQFDNGTLVMKNIKETDPSKMFCFIIPSRKNFEVQSKVAYIDIRAPAKVLPMKREMFKVAGTSFNLSCEVYGHTQKLFVTWFHHENDEWKKIYETCIYSRENQCINQYQKNDKKFTMITHSNNLTFHTVNLEFRDAVKSIAGLYKCKAKNKFNVIVYESSTNLTIISKPSKVENLDQISSSATDVFFRWDPPRDLGNCPILGYEIKYWEYQINANKKNIAQNISRVNSTTHFKLIDNLRPYRTYEISVVAENEVGKSEPNIILLTTQEAQPERSVRNLRASTAQLHEILISWDDPDSQYQNGKITHYEVCYQIIPTTEDSGNYRVSQLPWTDNVKNQKISCKTTKERLLTVPDLPQFTDFGIKVLAYNSKGNSPPSYTKVRTLEDLPQAPPTNLICWTQQRTIRLTWNPPNRQTINGVLIGYVVHYYKPNKYGDESNMSSLNVQGNTNVVLDQLEPYTGYSIQIMAVNRKGLGPPSSRIICTTLEAKPEPPEIAKAIKINNTCIAISWLHSQRPHGKIREYCVIRIGFSNERSTCQPPDYRKRYNNMTLCDNYDQYSKLKIFARNAHDGTPKEVNIKEYNGIVSIGGTIDVTEGSSIILACETSKEELTNVIWKRGNEQINNNENPNFIIFPNKSLEIKSVDKEGHSFSCSTEYDTIEYVLNVPETSDIQGLPKPPSINDVRVTENSVFISWTSGGTSDVSAPIISFSLTWENLYNGESKTVTLDANARTFYLNNVTCASEFHIKIRSKNSVGLSEPSHTKKFKTLGTIPQLPDSIILLPVSDIKSNSVNFNLNAFGPGDNCSAFYYNIEITLTMMGHSFVNPFIAKNISVHELENKCCHKVTGLNPSTHYKFQITAYNPAGSQVIFNSFRTIGVHDGKPDSKFITVSNESPISHSWLLMVILIIAVILIMVFLVLGVLYILRHRERRTRSTAETMPIRKPEFNQQRAIGHEDTTSIDSNGEPSPYAVYQPDNDPKNNHLWTQQVSQTSSTPGYNYPEHLYNQIRYDKIHHFTKPLPENQGDFIRRVNSAECLSSVGNASISGIADLESPSNIDPNNRIMHGSFVRGSNNDDVFQNIQFPSCSTVNRPYKRVRRESENLRFAEEERIKLVNPNNSMLMNWRNDPSTYRAQQQLMYNKMGNPNMRLQFRTQMSVPEPITHCNQPYGYSTNRVRTQSGAGPSQASMPGSASQINNFQNYYETHCSQRGYPTQNPKHRDNQVVNTPIEPYSKYVPSNHQSNYTSQSRTTVLRPEFTSANGNVPRPTRNECSDDEIYTDRVVVV